MSDDQTLDSLAAARLLEEKNEKLRKLEKFADLMLEAVWEGGGFDGGDIQEEAVSCGLLKEVEVTEQCGEGCVCAEFDFPQTCYRKTYKDN